MPAAGPRLFTSWLAEADRLIQSEVRGGPPIGGSEMTNRHIKIANRQTWAQGSNGYIKRCRYCGRSIYLKCDYDGTWRPYESWAAGNTDVNNWQRHDCPAISAAA